MANTPKLNKPKRISLNIEEEQYLKLKNNVDTVSGFFRECINNYLNTNDNLTDLKRELNNKINQRNNLNVDIEILENKIKELETTLKENENNNNILLELMETVKNVSSNEFNNNGITKDRIKAIANNKINANTLIKECEKQGVNIIKNGQITNSNIKPGKNNIDLLKEKNKNTFSNIVRIFFRECNNQYNKEIYKTKNKFLDNPGTQKKYKAMCNNTDIDFKEFKEYVLTHDC